MLKTLNWEVLNNINLAIIKVNMFELTYVHMPQVASTVMFDLETYNLLKKIANETNRSASSIIREAVKEWAVSRGFENVNQEGSDEH